MKIYIASSWKNQHGVEMLTALLREKGHEVISWVENNYGENHNHVTKKFSFDEWLNSEESDASFEFDTNGCKECDLMIFYTYAGCDAHAELGVAWAHNKIILGFYQKGAELGLMSKMIRDWVSRYTDVLDYVENYQQILDFMPNKSKRLLEVIGDKSPLLIKTAKGFEVWTDDFIAPKFGIDLATGKDFSAEYQHHIPIEKTTNQSEQK